MSLEKKHLRVDPSLHKKLKERAKKKGVFIEHEVEKLLIKGLEGEDIENEWTREERLLYWRARILL